MASKVAMNLGARSFSKAWTPAARTFAQKGLARTTVRRSTTAAAPSVPQKNMTFGQGLAGGLFLAGLHSATGSQNDFVDYRFKTDKESADLATFYGSEDFMELYCIFPFVGQIMMRNGEFDEKGNVLTTGIPGTMKVSMVCT